MNSDEENIRNVFNTDSLTVCIDGKGRTIAQYIFINKLQLGTIKKTQRKKTCG